MELPPLSIHLFGPLRVTIRGEPLPRVRTRSVEWLLALLALRHGRAVSRSWLAGTLWPESDESRGLQNLRDDHREALSIARSIGDRALEAGCLSGLASIEYERRDYGAARAHFQDSLVLARELGMHKQTAVSLYFLGLLAFQESDYAAARSLWEECREVDRRNQNQVGSVLGALAELAAAQGDTATARARWEESLGEGRELGRADLVIRVLRGLGDVARLEGDAAGARTRYSESLKAFEAAVGGPENKIGDERHVAQCAACLRGIATIASGPGREEQATRLLGAAEALAEAAGAVLSPAAQVPYQDLVAALRQAMGEEAFTAAWAEGRALTLAQAIDAAVS